MYLSYKALHEGLQKRGNNWMVGRRKTPRNIPIVILRDMQTDVYELIFMKSIISWKILRSVDDYLYK